ncbi:MAG: hypothetical protein PHQ34_07070 [Methanothrix sp.]|nr:hypothetical protein [Methanothrix sp.]
MYLIDLFGGPTRAVKRAGAVLRPQRRAGLDTWWFTVKWFETIQRISAKSGLPKEPLLFRNGNGETANFSSWRSKFLPGMTPEIRAEMTGSFCRAAAKAAERRHCKPLKKLYMMENQPHIISQSILLAQLEPVVIELRTSNNKIERTTNDRKTAHAAVDKFFDWHESEFKERI